ncbi:MAG: hypothetical protein GY772_20700, partial [bacterium]|nr:hypothetical protein [bacterium]
MHLDAAYRDPHGVSDPNYWHVLAILASGEHTMAGRRSSLLRKPYRVPDVRRAPAEHCPFGNRHTFRRCTYPSLIMDSRTVELSYVLRPKLGFLRTEPRFRGESWRLVAWHVPTREEHYVLTTRDLPNSVWDGAAPHEAVCHVRNGGRTGYDLVDDDESSDDDDDAADVNLDACSDCSGSPHEWSQRSSPAAGYSESPRPRSPTPSLSFENEDMEEFFGVPAPFHHAQELAPRDFVSDEDYVFTFQPILTMTPASTGSDGNELPPAAHIEFAALDDPLPRDPHTGYLYEAGRVYPYKIPVPSSRFRNVRPHFPIFGASAMRGLCGEFGTGSPTCSFEVFVEFRECRREVIHSLVHSTPSGVHVRRKHRAFREKIGVRNGASVTIASLPEPDVLLDVCRAPPCRDERIRIVGSPRAVVDGHFVVTNSSVHFVNVTLKGTVRLSDNALLQCSGSSIGAICNATVPSVMCVIRCRSLTLSMEYHHGHPLGGTCRCDPASIPSSPWNGRICPKCRGVRSCSCKWAPGQSLGIDQRCPYCRLPTVDTHRIDGNVPVDIPTIIGGSPNLGSSTELSSLIRFDGYAGVTCVWAEPPPVPAPRVITNGVGRRFAAIDSPDDDRHA